jgi:hypothetical protein
MQDSGDNSLRNACINLPSIDKKKNSNATQESHISRIAV